MDRMQKEALVNDLSDKLKSAELVIVARQHGLTVGEVSQLRAQVRGCDAEYRVVKNTLLRLVARAANRDVLEKHFQGPTALAFAKDPVGIAKVLAKFANGNNKFEIVGGILNDREMSAQDIKTLASIPSMDELRAKIVGVLVAPATKLARLTQEPAARIARVVAVKPN